MDNHTSATQFPGDVDAYIKKESKYGALLGPLKENHIAHSHVSPFMEQFCLSSSPCLGLHELVNCPVRDKHIVGC